MFVQKATPLPPKKTTTYNSHYKDNQCYLRSVVFATYLVSAFVSSPPPTFYRKNISRVFFFSSSLHFTGCLHITCRGWALGCGTGTCRSRRAASGPTPSKTRCPPCSAPPPTGPGSGPPRDTPSPGGCWSRSRHLGEDANKQMWGFYVWQKRSDLCCPPAHLLGLPCCRRTTSRRPGVRAWRSWRNGWFRCTSPQRETSAGGCDAEGPTTSPEERRSWPGCATCGSCDCEPSRAQKKKLTESIPLLFFYHYYFWQIFQVMKGYLHVARLAVLL